MDLYMVHIPYRFYILPYKMKQMYGKDLKKYMEWWHGYVAHS